MMFCKRHSIMDDDNAPPWPILVLTAIMCLVVLAYDKLRGR